MKSKHISAQNFQKMVQNCRLRPMRHKRNGAIDGHRLKAKPGYGASESRWIWHIDNKNVLLHRVIHANCQFDEHG